MAQQGHAGGRTQHGRLHALLVRPDDLRGKEPGVAGDAHATLLVVAAVPLHQGSRHRLRGMGGNDSGLVRGAPRTFVCQRFA